MTKYIGLLALESAYDTILLNLEHVMRYVTSDELDCEYDYYIRRIQAVREEMEIYDIVDLCNTSNWKWLP